MRPNVTLTCCLLAALSTGPVTATEATLSGTDGQGALGTIPCAGASGQPLQSCHAELRRKDSSTVSVAVLRPGGEVRNIYFENGLPTGSNATSALTSETLGDNLIVFIEPGEVYEIPLRALANQ